MGMEILLIVGITALESLVQGKDQESTSSVVEMTMRLKQMKKGLRSQKVLEILTRKVQIMDITPLYVLYHLVALYHPVRKMMETLLTLAITALESLVQERDQESISSVVVMTMRLKQMKKGQRSQKVLEILARKAQIMDITPRRVLHHPVRLMMETQTTQATTVQV